MTAARGFRLGVDVLRAEGPRAVLERWHDRRLDQQRRSSFPDVEVARLREILAQPAPVVNLLTQPPHRRLGGLAHQFLARYPEEAARRSCAVLYRDRGGYRLEAQSADARASHLWPAPPPASVDIDPSVRDLDFESTVRTVADLTGARAIHCEGVTGLPFASLIALAQGGLGLVLSLHDFGLFCARPHLLEEPAGQFCCYSRDFERCARCLGSPGPPQRGLQERRRAAAAELLSHASAIVFPSAFLRDRHAELFAVPGGRSLVIVPTGLAGATERTAARPPTGPAPHSGRRVAFVGSVQRHKGSAVFEEVVHSAGGLRTAPQWHVFGGGDRETLRRLRAQPNMHVHGYYRAGSLPARLVGEEIDVALLLSVVPESHGLTLEECVLAGVPVVAFDHGAVAERIRARGGGRLVPLEAGAEATLHALAGATLGAARTAGADPAPGERMCALYVSVGLLPP